MVTATNAVQTAQAGIQAQLGSVFNTTTLLHLVGWIIFGIIVITGAVFGYWWWYMGKLYNKRVTDFEIIGDYFHPTNRDTARTVKLGKGGFAVLYLRKTKTYRLVYGGRVGRNDYYFFIAPDGYPYNGLLGKSITKDGRVPIVATNQNMRAAYTSLEKQIAELHENKSGFWDKYGNWVLTLSFIMIIGIFAYLIYGELSSVLKAIPDILQKIGDLIDKVTILVNNAQGLNNTAKLTPGG